MVWCCSWGSREENCFTTWSTKDWLGVEDTGFNWTELQSDSAHTRWVCLQQRVAADPTDHKTHSTTPPSGCTLLLASLPSPTSSFTSLSPSQASVDKAKARTHTHTPLPCILHQKMAMQVCLLLALHYNILPYTLRERRGFPNGGRVFPNCGMFPNGGVFPNTRLITAVSQRNIGFSTRKQVHTYLLPSHSPTPFMCRCSFEERQATNRVTGSETFPPLLHITITPTGGPNPLERPRV